jgi:anti-sigma factor RsiW
MDRGCEDPRLSAYLDGELSAEEAAEVERHLAECATCRARLRALERIAKTLRRARPAAPAANPVIRPAFAAAPAAARRRSLWRWAVAGAAAAALVLGVRAGVSRPSEPAPKPAMQVRAAVDFASNQVVTLVSWSEDDPEPAK